MKILYIHNDYAKPSGEEHASASLAALLEGHGHEVKFFRRSSAEIANSFSGVEKCFAIQSGREVRIIVKPDDVNDAGTLILAREIVKRIEREMEYPGQIKVNVIRETRAVEFAK